jgi:hypothetical protein
MAGRYRETKGENMLSREKVDADFMELCLKKFMVCSDSSPDPGNPEKCYGCKNVDLVPMRIIEDIFFFDGCKECGTLFFDKNELEDIAGSKELRCYLDEKL